MRFVSGILLFCLLVVCGAGRGYAQLFVGAGFEYSVPVVTGNHTFVKADPLGLYGNIGLLLHENRIFPSFSYIIKSIKLPVDNATYGTLTGMARCTNYVLNLNYKTSGKDNYGVLFLGIGAAHILPQAGISDNAGNPLSLRDTGSTTLYPLVQAGVKYMVRIVPNGNFYLGLEANIKYIAMHNTNKYYLWHDTQFTPGHH